MPSVHLKRFRRRVEGWLFSNEGDKVMEKLEICKVAKHLSIFILSNGDLKPWDNYK